MEHSPVTQPLHDAGYCCLQPEPEFSANEYAWTKHTTMLYPEYPVGTGFSYGDVPETENEAAADLYQVLLNFFDIFPHLASHKFFVTGESYAGMFVPSVARYIHRMNQIHDRQINLAGAALGNGWMDAAVQGPATIDYSWWHGLIDAPTRDARASSASMTADGTLEPRSARSGVCAHSTTSSASHSASRNPTRRSTSHATTAAHTGMSEPENSAVGSDATRSW